MTSVIEKTAHAASGVVRHIGQLGAWLGLLLVCVVSFNVIARYLFGLGSVALQETEWHLMAAAALLGMSYGLNQGGEVRVDVLYARFPPRLQKWVDLAAALLLTAIAVIIAWLSLAYVQSSYSIGEGSPDPGGLGYRYLLKSVLPLAFGLLALQGVAMIGHALLRLSRSDQTSQPD